MAIERNKFSGSAQTSDAENIERIKQILDTLTNFEVVRNFDDKRIQDECNRVVRELVIIKVPSNADQIKEFQHHLNAVGQSLERIIRQSTNPEQIFISCLQTLYCELVSNGKRIHFNKNSLFELITHDLYISNSLLTESPSAASGIIFDIYDQDSIPKAIKLLIKNTANMGIDNDNDNDFKKVTQTLCTWLRTFSRLKNLSHCIIYFLDGLRVSRFPINQTRAL